jgi:hypothetical protein
MVEPYDGRCIEDKDSRLEVAMFWIILKAAASIILADIAWIVLTQAMWAMDKALGEDDAD